MRHTLTGANRFAPADAPEIDWTNFTFAHGFRAPRARVDFFGEPGAGGSGTSDSGLESVGGPSAPGDSPAEQETGNGAEHAGPSNGALAAATDHPRAAAAGTLTLTLHPSQRGGGFLPAPDAAAAAAAAAVSSALSGREGTPPVADGLGAEGGGTSSGGTPATGGPEKRVLTRARRGKSSAHTDFYMLDKGNVPVLSKKVRAWRPCLHCQPTAMHRFAMVDTKPSCAVSQAVPLDGIDGRGCCKNPNLRSF